MATTRPFNHPVVGLGGSDFSIAVYMANRPPLPEFENYSSFRGMSDGEIRFIADQTGNHWRKVFNVYSKLAFEIDPRQYDSWQSLRDMYLLQKHSDYALLFSKPVFTNSHIHIVMGKTYAESLGLSDSLEWLDRFFAIDVSRRLLVCPYFDYRQLSNIKIEKLHQLLKKHFL